MPGTPSSTPPQSPERLSRGPSGRLRLNGMIECLEGTNAYLSIFDTKPHNRLLRWRLLRWPMWGGHISRIGLHNLQLASAACRLRCWSSVRRA
jgi:hypothetical protein